VVASEVDDVAQAITRDRDTMHGIPVFPGRCVPVQNLFDYLEGGDTLEGFLQACPKGQAALSR